MKQSYRIIKAEDIITGGFAGIVEKQMVLSPDVWPKAKDRLEISHGLGDFIYLANGYFKPEDGVPMHGHNDVDIVSFIVSGSVGHKGTIGDGTVIHGPGVQVQRAGTGMQHSEFNLEKENSAIYQLWFKPPEKGLNPEYQNYDIPEGNMNTVLGGNTLNTFNSNMHCQIGFLKNGDTVAINEPFIAIISRGVASIDGEEVQEGSLIEGSEASLEAIDNLGLILVTNNQ